jgi:hypothetical protein
LGLILLFNGNQSVETDPSINPSNSKLINLNRGGEYDIFDDGTGVTTRGINILSGTDTAPINTTLNFDTGNVSLVKPTSAAAITLGEYNNVQLNINATSTNFTGYDPGSTQKDS